MARQVDYYLCMQRADLAARLTRLSVNPDHETLDREGVSIPMIAKEWRGLKSFKLMCLDPGGLKADSLEPILGSLEHLDILSSQAGALQTLIANEGAG